MTHDLIILGSGPAGCTAALYAARAGLRPLVLEGAQPGGQLTQTTDIENFPGLEQPVNGYDLVVSMRRQAERFGAVFEMDEAVGADFSGPVKQLETLVAGTLEARAVILATGASARWLGLPAEQALIGRGVSGCATCDGAFFRGKEVAVVGGGDVACEDALFLARLCSRVWLIHRRDALRASKVMAERVLASDVITPVWDTVVEDVLDPAAGAVTAVRLRNVKDGSLRDLPVSGLFVAIGHTPNTAFLKGAVDLDPRGYVAVRDGVRTSAEGVFAAGDVMDPDYKQAVVAAGAGAKAALEAERYLLG
ncbi:MAG TPA: thioredoxin-disulfide reductase [Candidatus Spyradenecus faecavium]|uniref:Thioredoxin reductase n=1 Tax=Candidatus Spyradenecus faecavium TaxID=2840947 RepID=A0A9D1T2D1_9BACT|nr:thioredoxin-disulfide reductase [Candidatus Spyradenecus faecavium]